MTRFEVVDGLDVFIRVPGWRLHLAHLALEPGSHERVFDMAIKGTLAGVRRRFPGGRIGRDTTLDAVRAALREHTGSGDARLATCERLAREVLDGADLPRRHPALVFRDLLTLRSMLPWSVFDASKVLEDYFDSITLADLSNEAGVLRVDSAS